MYRSIIIFLFIFLPIELFAQGMVKISSITKLDGETDNPILGRGLVFGLAGTGDQGDTDKIKLELALLKSLGTEIDESQISSKGMAIVMVQGELKPYMRKGQKISVTVGTKGSAKSLKGGILSPTLLKYPYLGQERVFGIARGPINVDEKNPNTGIVQATIEEDIPVTYLKTVGDSVYFDLILMDPSFANANTIANDINLLYSDDSAEVEGKTKEEKLARAIDASTVRVFIPNKFKKESNNFISEIQKLTITDYTIEARVLVNSRTGTVIVTGSVTMDPVAIAHGDLIIKIDDPKNPNAPQLERSLANLSGGFNLDSLVRSLNQMGTKPKDLVAILQKLHSQGVLHAKLEIE